MSAIDGFATMLSCSNKLFRSYPAIFIRNLFGYTYRKILRAFYCANELACFI